MVGKLFFVGWLGLLAAGLGLLFRYETTPGASEAVVDAWPESSQTERASDRPTLLLFFHPHCPCSRATTTELERILERVGDRVRTVAWVFDPEAFDEEWTRSELWARLERSPRVTVRSDFEAGEAQRFGAQTSGQAFLFTPDGTLLFSGGLTATRGHEGANGGQEALASLIESWGPTEPGSHSATSHSAFTGRDPIEWPVYGCPIYVEPSSAVSPSCCAVPDGT